MTSMNKAPQKDAYRLTHLAYPDNIVLFDTA